MTRSAAPAQKTTPLQELLRIAILGGQKLLALQEEVLTQMRQRGPLHQKGLGDFATEADMASERIIVAELQKSFPGIPIVAEESFGSKPLPATYITVDPLDGTIIYSRGCREWGATICLVEDGKPASGVIVFPAIGDEITAERGRGCSLNGRAVTCKAKDPAERFIFAVDTFYNTKPEEISGVIHPLVENGRILLSRSIGAAVGNVRALLGGEVDVYYCSGAKVWDVAASVLAVEEAGGHAASIFENPFDWRKLPKGQVFGCSRVLTEEVAGLGRTVFSRND